MPPSSWERGMDQLIGSFSVRHHIGIDPAARDRGLADTVAVVAGDHDRITRGIDAGDDADMAALIQYLKKLTVRHVPGVTDAELHFATIFTPDADPVKRAGVLDVLQHYVA